MGIKLEESPSFEDLIDLHRSRSYGIHNVKGIRVLMIIKSCFIHPTWCNHHYWLQITTFCCMKITKTSCQKIMNKYQHYQELFMNTSQVKQIKIKMEITNSITKSTITMTFSINITL
jgi:hypothetical protein